jgi:hypothetical protein
VRECDLELYGEQMTSLLKKMIHPCPRSRIPVEKALKRSFWKACAS